VTEILQSDWNASIWSGQVVDAELPDPFLPPPTHMKEGKSQRCQTMRMLDEGQNKQSDYYTPLPHAY